MSGKSVRIDHLGVAVTSLEEARKFYEDLGLTAEGGEEVPEQKVRVLFLPVGESRIELLESTNPDGPIGRFLAKKGPGLHHISLEVADLDGALERLAEKGYDLIHDRPVEGAGGARVAFVHPRSASGVLLELVEHR